MGTAQSGLEQLMNFQIVAIIVLAVAASVYDLRTRRLPNALTFGAALAGFAYQLATGGINAQNADTYMALPNVVMVGSSSMMPAASLKAKDWADIARRSRAFTDALDNITSV